ncbi:MAG: hypothetical protein GKR89_16720 [Candidatus Latescibacteria bacterium]|nr:hypothetical protein [Candidatus Latescibacterota bacterium]
MRIASPGAQAVEIQGVLAAPEIDGRLDDPVWQGGPSTSNFLQLDPVEGAAASEETIVRIAYDETGLYIGIRCYDSDPQGIVSRLTRRDGETEADWVSISLDPHLDRQTGRFFTVYASGSVIDGVYADDRSQDDTWDGVWEAAASVDAQGWSAELHIPYAVLRFSRQEEYVWGLNIERHISRKQERTHWNLMRKESPGLVSQFGYLEGIRGINPPLPLEYLPYAMGRTIVDGGTDYFGNAGLDFRYGVSSSLSLNATVNPDFGQVEADPAQLNLTAFEEFFDEQRPFFVEGASIFQTGDYNLFYSRRIGRQPGYVALPQGAQEHDRPEATTILGAVKLTGKTQGKTAFGLLQAVTAPEYADISLGAEKDEFRVEPLTNYLVGRVRQDVLDGTSGVGLFASSVHRRDGASAYVGAADWDLRFHEDRYAVTGSLVASRAGAPEERNSGYIAHLEFDKRGGSVESEVGFVALSRDIDINDLGFLRRGDLLQSWGQVQFFRYTPIGPLREFDMRLEGEVEWNYDRLLLNHSYNLSNWSDLHNYWRIHLHFGRELAAHDDDDVRRGGPIIKRLAETWMHARIETDPRKALSFYIHPDWRQHDGGDSYVRGLRTGVEWRPLPSMQFSMEPRYERRVTDAQWVDAIADDNGLHFVYGELESRTLDLTTRAELNFAPGLSLELYLQPFIAIGDFGHFKELNEPETYRFSPYALNENRDFHRRSLKSNLVLRWEFSPGSTLFVVWSQSRSEQLDDPRDRDLDFRPLSRIGSAFADEGNNVLLMKASYWIGG